MGGRGALTSFYRFRLQVVTCLRSHAASDATFTAESQRGRSDSGDPTAVVDDDAPMFSRCCISAPQEHIRSRRSRRDSGSTTSRRNSTRSHAQSCSSSRRRIATRSRAFPRKKGGAPSSDSNTRWTMCWRGCRSNPTRWRRRSTRHRQAAITPYCRRWIGSVVAIVATVAGLFGKAEAQYKTGTALYEDHMDIAEAELTATLKGGDYVEDVFYPDRQVRTTSSIASIRMNVPRMTKGRSSAVITPAVPSLCTACTSYTDSDSEVKRDMHAVMQLLRSVPSFLVCGRHHIPLVHTTPEYYLRITETRSITRRVTLHNQQSRFWACNYCIVPGIQYGTQHVKATRSFTAIRNITTARSEPSRQHDQNHHGSIRTCWREIKEQAFDLASGLSQVALGCTLELVVYTKGCVDSRSVPGVRPRL